jgi:divalent metal cation (Fe/Co/Zn/Cd) transporter
MLQVMTSNTRMQLRRKALGLAWFTVVYNFIEGLIAVSLGTVADSIALVGFGLDSGVEVLAALVIVWRFTRIEKDANHAEKLEKRAVLLVGISFFVLAFYIGWQSISKLLVAHEPEASLGGIILAVTSLIVMPVLAAEKRKVAVKLNSRSLASESTQTQMCSYLSAVLLLGLTLNLLFSWWWADPTASLVIVVMMVKEGWENVEVVRGRKEGGCCSSC